MEAYCAFRSSKGTFIFNPEIPEPGGECAGPRSFISLYHHRLLPAWRRVDAYVKLSRVFNRAAAVT